MDFAEQQAIQECGRCHRPEWAHYDADGEAALVVNVLAGCQGFQVSAAALRKVKAQARAPGVSPRCLRCGGKGHEKRNCPW